MSQPLDSSQSSLKKISIASLIRTGLFVFFMPVACIILAVITINLIMEHSGSSFDSESKVETRIQPIASIKHMPHDD